MWVSFSALRNMSACTALEQSRFYSGLRLSIGASRLHETSVQSFSDLLQRQRPEVQAPWCRASLTSQAMPGSAAPPQAFGWGHSGIRDTGPPVSIPMLEGIGLRAPDPTTLTAPALLTDVTFTFPVADVTGDLVSFVRL